MDAGVRLILLRMALGPVIVATSSCTFTEVRSPGCVISRGVPEAISSCIFTAAKSEVNLPPPQKYSTFIVGDIGVEDKAFETFLPKFTSGVARLLVYKGAFETVGEGTPSGSTGSAITLSGKITKDVVGNAVDLYLTLMGAGQMRVGGRFEIKDPEGKTLLKFERIVVAYDPRLSIGFLLGAAGAGTGVLPLAGGGLSIVDQVRETLMQRLAEAVAENTLKWSTGEKID